MTSERAFALLTACRDLLDLSAPEPEPAPAPAPVHPDQLPMFPDVLSAHDSCAHLTTA